MPPSNMLYDDGADDWDWERQRLFGIDTPCDLMALIVLDEFSNDTVTKILQDNKADQGVALLWLAMTDNHEDVPDNIDEPIEGTTEIEAGWRSPFIGDTIEKAARWIQAIPKPEKAVLHSFFAVVKKDSSGECITLICKTPKEDVGRPEVETIPCSVDRLGMFFSGFPRDSWEIQYDDQVLY